MVGIFSQVEVGRIYDFPPFTSFPKGRSALLCQNEEAGGGERRGEEEGGGGAGGGGEGVDGQSPAGGEDARPHTDPLRQELRSHC